MTGSLTARFAPPRPAAMCARRFPSGEGAAFGRKCLLLPAVIKQTDMKQAVRITVTNCQTTPEGSQTTRHRFEGHASWRAGRLLLTYREAAPACLTHLLAGPDSVDLRRSGEVESRMVLAEGLRHDFAYRHALGTFDLSVVTHSLHLSEGGFTAEYDLLSGGCRVASHRLSVRWKAAE